MDKGLRKAFDDFSEAAARDGYLTDPEHRKTGAKIVASAVEGLSGICVYDIEIAGN